jgi:hypothetical protein
VTKEEREANRIILAISHRSLVTRAELLKRRVTQPVNAAFEAAEIGAAPMPASIAHSTTS